MADKTRQKSSSRKTIIAIVFIIALGAFFRFWGIGFGLPDLYHPDEQKIVSTAMAFGTGDLNPHFFRYPSFYMYIQFFIYGIFYLLGLVTGVFTGTYDFAFQFASDPSSVYLLGRSVTATFGVGIIILIFFIGKELLDVPVALIAALFTACSFLLVQDSHFVSTDIPVTFMVVLSAFLALLYLKSGKLAHLLFASVVCGLAASTKYNGGLCIVTLMTAILIRAYRTDETPSKRIAYTRFLPVILFSALGFVIGTPYALLDFAAFWKGLSFELSHSSFGHLGFVKERIGWWFHFRNSLVHGIGWPIAIIGMGGMAYSIFRPKSPLFIFAPFSLLYFLMIGFANTLFQRYALLLIPFVGLFAAWVLERFFNRYSQNKTLRIAALGATLLLFLLPNLSRITYHDHLLTKKDTRTLCAEWIEQNVPPGTTIVLDAYGPQLLSTDSTALGTYAGRQVKENIKKELIKLGKSYNVINLSHEGKYEAQWVADQKPAYIILSSYIVDRVFEHSEKFGTPNQFIQWVRNNFSEVKVYSPYKDPLYHPKKFNLKSLMSPSVGDLFDRQKPGPVLWVYATGKP